MLAADHPELVRSVILFAAGGKIPPKPAADRALMTIFNPASTEPEVLEAMTYMVGKSEDVAKVWGFLKPCRAPQMAGIERTAAESTPLSAWWAPAGREYSCWQGTDDQARCPLLALSGHAGSAPHMSAFGGKADMAFAGSPLSRSLLGVKRTCLFALLHVCF